MLSACCERMFKLVIRLVAQPTTSSFGCAKWMYKATGAKYMRSPWMVLLVMFQNWPTLGLSSHYGFLSQFYFLFAIVPQKICYILIFVFIFVRLFSLTWFGLVCEIFHPLMVGQLQKQRLSSQASLIAMFSNISKFSYFHCIC